MFSDDYVDINIFELLPDEIILQIFQFLLFSEDPKYLKRTHKITALVCKKFNRLVWDSNLHRQYQIKISQGDSKNCLNPHVSYLAKVPKLKILKVVAPKMEMQKLIKCALSLCLELESLTMDNPYVGENAFDSVAPEIGSYGKVLRSLTLTSDYYNPELFSQRNTMHLKNIKELSITCDLTDCGMINIGEQCPHLEIFEFQLRAKHISEVALSYFFRRVTPTLKELSVDFISPVLSINSFVAIIASECQLLERLSLCAGHYKSSLELEIITELKYLKYFHIEAFYAKKEKNEVFELKSLETLSMKFWIYKAQANWNDFSKTFPCLKNLRLEFSTCLITFIEEIDAGNFQNLKNLNLIGFLNLCPEEFLKLKTNLTTLTQIIVDEGQCPISKNEAKCLSDARPGLLVRIRTRFELFFTSFYRKE